MNDIVSIIMVLGGSLIAIGLLVLLNIILGGAGARRFSNLDQAKHYIEQNTLGFRASGRAVLVQQGQVALALDKTYNRFAVVRWLGDKPVLRTFGFNELDNIQLDGSQIVLYFNDYAFPDLSVRFDDLETARSWHSELSLFLRSEQWREKGSRHDAEST